MPDGRRPANERGDSEGTPAVVLEALSIYGYGDFDGLDQSASSEPPAQADLRRIRGSTDRFNGAMGRVSRL
jgi:hypothetical protein